MVDWLSSGLVKQWIIEVTPGVPEGSLMDDGRLPVTLEKLMLEKLTREKLPGNDFLCHFSRLLCYKSPQDP